MTGVLLIGRSNPGCWLGVEWWRWHKLEAADTDKLDDVKESTLENHKDCHAWFWIKKTAGGKWLTQEAAFIFGPGDKLLHWMREAGAEGFGSLISEALMALPGVVGGEIKSSVQALPAHVLDVMERDNCPRGGNP